MYYVYLIESRDKELYIGCTNNLKKRIEAHNSGKVASTKFKRPYQFLYCEVFISKHDAFERESKLKYHAQSLRRLKERLKMTLKS